jgi:hypothetical protein
VSPFKHFKSCSANNNTKPFFLKHKLFNCHQKQAKPQSLHLLLPLLMQPLEECITQSATICHVDISCGCTAWVPTQRQSGHCCGQCAAVYSNPTQRPTAGQQLPLAHQLPLPPLLLLRLPCVLRQSTPRCR